MKALFDLEQGVPGVRLATKADEGDIYALLVLMHAEMGFFTMNPEKVIAGIKQATDRQGGIIFVIDDGLRAVASLGMTISNPAWYTDDEALVERWNFVHPDYRRTDYARKLLETGKWAHEWFKARGKLMPFVCGINSFHRTEAKIRLFARYMPCIGGNFMYGEPPRYGELMRRELAHLEEIARQHTRGKVPAAVETLIRVTKRPREEQGAQGA